MSLGQHVADGVRGPTAGPLARATKVKWRAPIIYLVITALAAVLLIGFAADAAAEFRLSTDGDAWQLPPIMLPGRPTGWVVVLAALAATAVATTLALRRRKVPLWLTIAFAAVLLVGFLTWAGSTATLHSIPVASLLAGSIGLAVPLVFGSLAGVIGERAGVVNIAIEGQLLLGAFSSAVVASITGSPWPGLLAAALAGVLVAMVLAVFSIKYFVDQIIVGVVLNVLVSGLTGFLFSELLAPNREVLNTPPRFDIWAIPGLSDIPVIGPMLFRQTPIVYLAYIAIVAVWWGLFHTRWGLRVRSVGEHPMAADTVGIDVNRTRFWNVSLGGAIAGIGGAFYTLGSVGAFNKDMTAGAGYIALAAVIFGRWHPVRAALAALLFGFTTYLQSTLSIIQSPVPSSVLLALPYVVTILAVAGFVGASRAPAADGQPYIKS